LGARTATKVNVRIIAATHQNLESLVEQGIFREDLFHRLNVIRIQIPALNERSQDIPVLLQHFLNLAAKELETESKSLSSEAESYLCQLAWPGNIRQLENICRWLSVMTGGREIHIKDLPPEFFEQDNHQQASMISKDNWENYLLKSVQQSLENGEINIAKKVIEIAEFILIQTTLKHTQGKRQEAASLLGYGRNTLTRKIKDLKIEE
jgi:two-component system nitrogen regulation response regulator GlnG